MTIWRRGYINGNLMRCATCGEYLIGERQVSDWGWPYRCFVCEPPQEDEQDIPAWVLNAN